MFAPEENRQKRLIFFILARQLADTYRTLEDNRAVIAAGDDLEIVEIARSELEELEATCGRLEEELKFLLVPKDPSDHKNTIIDFTKILLLFA